MFESFRKISSLLGYVDDRCWYQIKAWKGVVRNGKYMKNDSSKHIQKQNLLIQYLQSNQYRLIRFIKLLLRFLPADIYLLKVNNRNTSTRCEIYLKLTIKTAERRHWRRSGVFIVNFKHILNLVLAFLWLTMKM